MIVDPLASARRVRELIDIAKTAGDEALAEWRASAGFAGDERLAAVALRLADRGFWVAAEAEVKARAGLRFLMLVDDEFAGRPDRREFVCFARALAGLRLARFEIAAIRCRLGACRSAPAIEARAA